MPFAKNLQVRPWMQLLRGGGLTLVIGLCACSSQSSKLSSATSTSQYGTLTFVANGEDFVRRGFVSKDQWQIKFDHVYVTLDQITADQTSFIADDSADSTREISNNPVTVPQPITVDLAQGDEQADPITVASIQAPAGHYRGLAWQLTPAETGPAQGSSLMLEGQAQKQNTTVQFSLKLDPRLDVKCGDFVGEERKGILNPNQSAELESTFHFDHLFGDADAEPDAEINQSALGFTPIAALAESGQVKLDMPTLMSRLSPEEADSFQALLANLGHVGEGHCEASNQ